MIQFFGISNYFEFNGIQSKNFNYMLCSVGSSDSETKINGLDRDITEEDGIGDIKNVTKVTNKYVEFNVSLTKCESNGNLLKFTEEDLFFINRWLFNVNEYKEMTLDNGLAVNTMFTKSSSFYNSAGQGYINLTMRCYPCYTNNIQKRVVVVTSKDNIIIENKSNVDGVGLDIDIVFESGTNVSIQNLVNGKTFTIENLTTTNEKNITINGSCLRYIESNKDSSLNILKRATKKEWDCFQLQYGVNTFKVTTDGKVNMTFRYKTKVQYY